MLVGVVPTRMVVACEHWKRLDRVDDVSAFGDAEDLVHGSADDHGTCRHGTGPFLPGLSDDLRLNLANGNPS